MMECLIVSLGARLFGIPCDNVSEILTHKGMTPVPGAGSHIGGVYHLRNRIITSLSLPAMLSVEASAQSYFQVVLLHEKMPVYSFAVEQVEGVESFADNALQRQTAGQAGVLGFFHRSSDILPVLDVPAILDLFENERILT